MGSATAMGILGMGGRSKPRGYLRGQDQASRPHRTIAVRVLVDCETTRWRKTDQSNDLAGQR